MMMRPDSPTSLRRRQLLRVVGTAGLLSLSGCGRDLRYPLIFAPSGVLPKRLVAELPRPWELRTATSADQWRQAKWSRFDLLALTDGWLETLESVPLQSIAVDPLTAQLGLKAQQFLSGLGPLRSKLLPAGVSPWVMLLLRKATPKEAAKQGWSLLLDPSLRGRVVLPDSPRLVMELSARLSGEKVALLKDLRRQVLSFDDRQGINWLLKGQADVVVLPLQRCLPLLRRDPRLSVVLPERGAPLHWTVLVRPESTREPLPQDWILKAWQDPLRRRLLEAGWRAPLPESVLAADRDALPERWRSLVLPPEQVWNRCWSLKTLTPTMRADLLSRWKASAP